MYTFDKAAVYSDAHHRAQETLRYAVGHVAPQWFSPARYNISFMNDDPRRLASVRHWADDMSERFPAKTSGLIVFQYPGVLRLMSYCISPDCLNALRF